VPAQVRIQQTGLAFLVGHITGGTVTNGTILGVLPPGYYNPTAAQTINVTAMTGAATSHAGAVSTGILPSFEVPSAAYAFTIAAGGFNGGMTFGPSNVNFRSGGLNITAQTLTLNENDPLLTLDVLGNLTLSNVDPNVTALSFSQQLVLA
jgi:hypothetical protein